MKSKAEKWDDGCKTNNVRNMFVVPKLVELINEIMPSRVLDVGTGTGYIAKRVDELIDSDVNWTLLDMDADRIEFIENTMPQSVNYQASTIDFTKLAVTAETFDLVLFLFTLLELKLDLELFSRIKNLTSEKGHVVIALPDILEDVLNAAALEPSLLNDFAQGRCVISKTDKFTGEGYPFKAHRFEDIVQLMLYSGFSLRKMLSYTYREKETYMLVFRKDNETE